MSRNSDNVVGWWGNRTGKVWEEDGRVAQHGKGIHPPDPLHAARPISRSGRGGGKMRRVMTTKMVSSATTVMTLRLWAASVRMGVVRSWRWVTPFRPHIVPVVRVIHLYFRVRLVVGVVSLITTVRLPTTTTTSMWGVLAVSRGDMFVRIGGRRTLLLSSVVNGMLVISIARCSIIIVVTGGGYRLFALVIRRRRHFIIVLGGTEESRNGKV